MTNFAILRVQKVKSFSSLAARGRHNFREQDTPNADSDRTELNVIEGASSTDELLQAVSDLLPAKRRKDAVIGLEYLITASPEHFGDWQKNGNAGEKYFADAIDWLEARHGKDNVVCATVHLDESTPHLAAFVVPLTKAGRLAARDFVGGSATLTKMQTAFAAEVGAKHGLVRGLERSKAVHQDAAKIRPMTAERLALRKQVKDLEAEIERLTKHVDGGEAALSVATAALAEQERRRKAKAALKGSDVVQPSPESFKAAQEALLAQWGPEREATKLDMQYGRVVAVVDGLAVLDLGRGVRVRCALPPGAALPQVGLPLVQRQEQQRGR